MTDLTDPANKFSFFWDANGMLTANDKMKDIYAWYLDFPNLSYENKTGKQEVMMARSNPGIE